MLTHPATTEYMKLTVSERIQLVEDIKDIRDSIAAEAPDTVVLSQAQKGLSCIFELLRTVPILLQRLHGDRFEPSCFRIKPDVGGAPSRGRARASGGSGLV